jgi:DNA-binding winged helix-turn-helix (wHTH) protein
VKAEDRVSLRFGDFTFDPGARDLVRHGRRLELSPKALELLLALLEAHPRALSRAEIHDRLWPRTFVSDASLRQVVRELRRVLEDEPEEPGFIRTVRRFGYAFSATVAEEVPAAGGTVHRLSRYSLLRGGRELPLYEGENLLGREPEAVVRLVSDKASRRHARIVVGEAGAILEDLDSKNGTHLNGTRIRRAVVLEAGDRVEIGRELLVFCRGAAGTTRTDLT